MLQWTLGCMSFWIMVFSRYISRSGSSGSYGNSIFSFLKEPPYCSYGCTKFAFPPTVYEGSFFSTPSPAIIVVDFFMMAILTDVRWYLYGGKDTDSRSLRKILLWLFCLFFVTNIFHNKNNCRKSRKQEIIRRLIYINLLKQLGQYMWFY